MANLLTITPQEQQRLATLIGQPIPNPNKPEFREFLEQLEATNPSHAEEIRNAVQPITIAHRQQRKKAEGAEKQRVFWEKLFMREQPDGTKVPHKNKIIMIGTVCAVLFGVGAVGLMSLKPPKNGVNTAVDSSALIRNSPTDPTVISQKPVKSSSSSSTTSPDDPATLGMQPPKATVPLGTKPTDPNVVKTTDYDANASVGSTSSTGQNSTGTSSSQNWSNSGTSSNMAGTSAGYGPSSPTPSGQNLGAVNSQLSSTSVSTPKTTRVLSSAPAIISGSLERPALRLSGGEVSQNGFKVLQNSPVTSGGAVAVSAIRLLGAAVLPFSGVTSGSSQAGASSGVSLANPTGAVSSTVRVIGATNSANSGVVILNSTTAGSNRSGISSVAATPSGVSLTTTSDSSPSAGVSASGTTNRPNSALAVSSVSSSSSNLAMAGTATRPTSGVNVSLNSPPASSSITLSNTPKPSSSGAASVSTATIRPNSGVNLSSNSPSAQQSSIAVSAALKPSSSGAANVSTATIRPNSGVALSSRPSTQTPPATVAVTNRTSSGISTGNSTSSASPPQTGIAVQNTAPRPIAAASVSSTPRPPAPNLGASTLNSTTASGIVVRSSSSSGFRVNSGTSAKPPQTGVSASGSQSSSSGFSVSGNSPSVNTPSTNNASNTTNSASAVGQTNAIPGVPDAPSVSSSSQTTALPTVSAQVAGIKQLETLLPGLSIGARIPAKLVLEVVAVEQGESPIVAESIGLKCGDKDCPKITWVGFAKLGPDRRVWALFNQAIVDSDGDGISETYSLVASAVGADDFRVGLPANITDEAPSLVSDLLRGTVGSLADFLTSSLGAKTTTIIPGGGAQQSSSVPGLGSFFLGRLGDLFSIPSGSKALIRVAKVPLSSNIVVLYGVNAYGQPASK
jgi:hypothetical protein